MKNSTILLITFLLFTSCASLEDAGKVLRNEKIKTTDEFLVEKRDPLVFPPDFEKIPEPGTKEKIQTSEEERIKKILKANEQKNVSNSNPSSVEDSILNKIRK
jgi:PBP1b-binding outer membrane lipoprotein LpoB